MIYVVGIMFLVGLAGGAAIVFVALWEKRRILDKRKIAQDARAKMINDGVEIANARQKALDQQEMGLLVRQQELEARVAEAAKARQKDLDQREAGLLGRQQEFDARVISYKELQNENAMLKRDLQNIDVKQRKLMLDGELHSRKQQELDQRCTELGDRYFKENVKWIGSSLNANNFAACKQRLLDVIERCRGIGFEVTAEKQDALVADLKAEYEQMVRAALEHEEQDRIKAQMREEQKLQREVDRELKQLERERAAIQAALEKALAEAKDKHSEEVERLKARLTEAEEKSQRAVARAQLTKSGHIYVISNIGSFGQDVFKIGMTRRLEPKDRVRELSSASVPFPFDVHMMISSDDAPALETTLHRFLFRHRLNKANPRKEFFRIDIETIRKMVLENHGEVQYVVDPEALEYRQSLTMSDEDAEYIEGVYDKISGEDENLVADE